eukprot:2843330-Pleurochrysis_carterae.AAC.1
MASIPSIRIGWAASSLTPDDTTTRYARSPRTAVTAAGDDLWPDSPKALLACFSIYVPSSRVRVRRCPTPNTSPVPMTPTPDVKATRQPYRLRAWPDASPDDLRVSSSARAL